MVILAPQSGPISLSTGLDVSKSAYGRELLVLRRPAHARPSRWRPAPSPLSIGAAGDATPLLQEAADGRYVNVEPFSLRLNPGESGRVTLYARQFAQPLAGLVLPIGFDDPGLDGGNSPQGALGFSKTVTTLPSGQVSIEISVCILPSPQPGRRTFIDSQVYFLGGYWEAWGQISASSGAAISVLVFDEAPPIDQPTWADVQPVLNQYAVLYPAMKGQAPTYRIIRRSPPARRRSSRSSPRRSRYPAHMPVTRDLSVCGQTPDPDLDQGRLAPNDGSSRLARASSTGRPGPRGRGDCADRRTVMMKLIISGLASLDHYVSREFSYIIRELIATHGWKSMEFAEFGDGSRPLRDLILGKFDERPDVILFWEGYGFINRHARQIHALDCKKVVFADDLHWRDEAVRWSKLLAYLVCDMVISTYADRFEAFYPEVCRLKPIVWSPHSASPDFLLPLNEQAENSVFLSGAMSRVYPLRRMMRELAEGGRYRITCHPHPGYHCGYDHGRDPAVGPGYARAIHGHRTAFTDALVYGYLVAKFFEIPATGALLLADASVAEPMRRLGFLEDEHYVPASAENLEDRLHEVLDESNHARLDAMRRRAQALVLSRHTTSDRARLIDEACRPGS